MIGLLLVVAAWPVAHRIWVAQSGVSPWKFFGWAMYCEPRFHSRLEFRVAARPASGAEQGAPAASEGRRVRYPRNRIDARRALARYRQSERAWLRQTDPGDLAEAVFAAYPSLDRLELRRHWTRYDVDLGLPVHETEILGFERESSAR